MKTVELQYYATFGPGDSSDYMDWEVDLTDEEEALYNKAAAKGIPFEEIPELVAILDRAREEIEKVELENFIDMGDESVLECLGLFCMDVDELNELVHIRDPHALEYFGLEDTTDEDIAAWDAGDLDKLPTVAEFKEDFEPGDPFAECIDLHVEFPEPDFDDDWLDFDDEEDEDQV